MPSTENSGTSSPLGSLGRSIWSFRREQVHTMEPNHDLESELELFQGHVRGRFEELASASTDELLSIPWIQKLLDAFVCSIEEFRALVSKNKGEFCKPPLDRLLEDFMERSVKALDICNATRDGIEKMRSWQKHLDIVLCAFRNKALSEGQFRRARKALMDLALAMLDERDSGSAISHRNRSFGRHNMKKDHQNQSSGSGSGSGHTRSLSWSVSHSWSAAKQLQSIASNLVPPRGNEIVASNGLAAPVFTMNFVLVFVLWTLVAAIPCQDRGGGLNVHFSVPRNLAWGSPLMSIRNRISEESKKRELRNSAGLLREICQLERCSDHTTLTDLADSVNFPLTEEQQMEVEQRVQEIAMVSQAFQNGLDPLERQVRQVFRTIMNCRTEGLDILNKANF